MNRHLLDVNVLLALVWPRHESHDAAHAWFAKSGHKAWATSPLTQLGVLRLLTNPAVTQGVVSAAAALEAVDEATQHEGHEFWPLDRGMTTGLKTLAARLQGHRQWTDAVLLWQATERGGVLVTFDSGVKTLAPRDAGGRVLILKRS
ncbi:MAG TPA: TA system VapC family ribonuclease toxin [Bryobacteraceae bacterium]|nr:TA system VapC family ribonuclease toxin [Bryobacteraceae bacterium]